MLSVTALSSYMYCKRKLYLNRVLKLYEPPKAALVKGTIRHETYDLINKNQENLVKSIREKLSLEKIKEKFKDKYEKFLKIALLNNKKGLKQFDIKPEELFKQVYPLILEEAETRSFNIFNFIEKTNLLGQELWENLTPKIQSEVKIESKELGLRGIIDQIEVYEESMVPVELKTGKAPRDGVWPGHKIQIAAYALLLKENNKQVKEGFITYLDIKERRHIAINSFLIDEIKELINKVNLLLNTKSLPDHCENQNKCNACSLKEDCYDEKKMNKLLKEKT